MSRLPALILVLLAAVAPGCGGDGEDDAANPGRGITLALDFQPNPVHAGIFTAIDRGLDGRQGLELTVRTPAASTDSLKLLAAGKADFSVVDIHDLGLARERGQDVVGVGAVVQRPLAAVIARRGVRRPRDLEGRRVGVTGLPSDQAVLESVVRADGGDPRRVRTTTIGFAAVPSLAAGKVDAVVTFWNAEGVALRRRGVRTREFRVDRYGAPRYPELVLATRRSTLKRDPALARRLTAAVRAGTEAARADLPAAAASVRRRSQGDAALTRAQLAAVAPAFVPAVRLDRRSLEGWAAFDTRFGILERRPDVDRAFSLD
ncbi:MAG TPA: ABC transporter substrate-binding protein [Thermoleophilaceae bacterium]|nr:ABC transporter substrate-binding protein [Thermoleophilaceae bacterium]